MKATRVCVVFALAWCLQTGTSYAVEDWLDHLSGPGRFWGFSVPYRFLCLSKASGQENFRKLGLPGDGVAPPAGGVTLSPEAVEVLREGDRTFVTWMSPLEQAAGIFPSHPPDAIDVPTPLTRESAAAYRRGKARYDCQIDQRVHSYLSVSPGFYWSKKNRLFPADPKNSLYRVWIWHADLEYVYRLNRYFDVNAGIGFNRFSGDVFSSFTRVSLTPIAIHFAPFGKRDDQLARALRVGVGITSFVGGFDATDFCNVDPVTCAGVNANFTSEKERLFKYFVDLDPAFFKWLFNRDAFKLK
jgi:hypothetical protein